MMIRQIEYGKGDMLSYAEYGDPDGFPILIQHGMIASIEDGALFERLLSRKARLICAARPGYGASSPYPLRCVGEWGEVVRVLVGALNLKQFDVLGISSGAPYGYAIASCLPDQTRKLFILSGTPALFDAEVAAHWPYPLDPTAGMEAMQSLAREVFFSNLSEADLRRNDIRDSMAHDCFGVALDLAIRCRNWGFDLEEVRTETDMQHSRDDDSVPLITAQITAAMLPTCALRVRENGGHFSQDVLNDFIDQVMADQDPLA